MKNYQLAISLLVLPIAFAVIAHHVPAQEKTKITLPHKTVTLKGDAIPLTKALESILDQTGIRVVDRRSTDDDPSLQLQLKDASFWEAVDTIAKKADCALYLYGNGVSLVDGKPPVVQSSRHSAFRTALKRLDLIRNFDLDIHQCRLALEFAWQPDFLPFYMEVNKFTAVFSDNDEAKEVSGEGKGWLEVHGRSAIEVDNLLLPAPPREAKKLKTLQGEFTIVGSRRMETVVFKDLKQAADGKALQEKIGKHVTVTLKKFDELDDDLWQAEIELQYPADGPKFETHQLWTTHNRIWLQNVKEKDRKIEPGRGAETRVLMTSNRAIIQYRFGEEQKVRLGQPGDWYLYYRTPERIIEVSVPFEFKDVPLP